MKGINVCSDTHFLSQSECSSMLESILWLMQNVPVPHVFRKCGERSLNYQVIDGHQIAEHLPAVTRLSRRIQELAQEFSKIPVAPLANPRVAINVNITQPGGEYRWHYDRNAVTAILYLNEVVGGEIEMFEDYRILLESHRFTLAQKVLDETLLSRIFRWIFSSRQHLIKPKAGELIIMKGNRCLHSVRRVRGNIDRVCIVFAFDTPGKRHSVDATLDAYLYSNEFLSTKDPNYANRSKSI